MRNKCEDCCCLSYNNEDCNCGIDPYEFNLNQQYEELYLMDLEYRRCELLRFFKKYDPKGKLKRFLKKKGKYPYWIEDLFYVDKVKEERKKKIKEENNGQEDA